MSIGDEDIAKYLINMKKDIRSAINERNSAGEILLHFAARKNMASLALYLINRIKYECKKIIFLNL